MRDFTNVIGYIYKIISPNKKIYIGQTININSRKTKYKYKFFKGQIKLWLNCEKYNWNPIDNFTIIEECLCGENKKTLNEKEKFWINFYDSFKNGLNCNEGGNGNLNYIVSDYTKKVLSLKAKEQWNKMSEAKKKIRSEKLSDIGKFRKHTIETIEKIKNSKKLNPFKPSDEFKQKISNSLTGKPGRNKGNFHSEESKLKISKTKSGVKNEKNSKKIICITTNTIYDSMTEASLKLGLNQSKISMVCNNKRKSTGGFRFKYYLNKK